MIENIKEELLNLEEEYLIIENDKIISHSNNLSSFIIDKSLNLKIIYLINQKVSLRFKIAKNLELKITEIYHDVKEDLEVNYDVAENSRVDYLSIKKRNDKENANFGVITNITLARDAYINIKELGTFKETGTAITNIYLNDEATSTVINNVYINSSSLEQDYKINTYHEKGNTTSEIKVYGIAKNASIIKIDTKGYIRKDAGNANLNQKTKCLILDEASNIHANPILEIDHFDCYAGHGASIGALDDDELYYLMSRGLSRIEAEKLIVGGFISPFIGKIEDDKIKNIVEKVTKSLFND